MLGMVVFEACQRVVQAGRYPTLFLFSFASFSHTSRSIAIKALSLSFFCTRPDRFPLPFGSKSVSMLALAIPLVLCPTSRPSNVQLCIRLSLPATARPPSPTRRPATDMSTSGLPRRRMTPHPHPHPQHALLPHRIARIAVSLVRCPSYLDANIEYLFH